MLHCARIKERGLVLRMYDMGGILLNRIKGIYVNSIACVRVKEDESKCFRINSGVREIRAYHVPLAFPIYI